LDAWVSVGQSRRTVESGLGDFFWRWFGGLFHCDEDADFGFLALDDAAEVAYIRRMKFACLNRQNNLFSLAAPFSS